MTPREDDDDRAEEMAAERRGDYDSDRRLDWLASVAEDRETRWREGA